MIKEITWMTIGSGLHAGISTGTGKDYSIIRVKVISKGIADWEMFEGDKSLGVRGSLEDCKIAIEEWDTEPDD